MPDLAPRLPCPVCLGVVMEKVAVGPGGALTLDHCRRCGGAWLEHGEVQQLRAAGAADLWRQVEKRGDRFRMRCHDCHAPLERAEEKCPACGWTNTLACPGCDTPMRVESHAGLRLDVCRGCRGVWFDHHELEAIWGASFDHALQRRRLSAGGTLAAVGDGAGDVLLHTLFFSPDLLYYGVRGAGHAVAASAELVAHVPGALAAAPGAASTVFEVAGEAAGAVFEAIVSIIAGIFDGL